MRTIPADSRPSLALADGRRVALADLGPRDGTPVLYCHGAIGTPVEASVDLVRLTETLGIRWIAPGRPGIGGSDPRPGRSVHSWAADAAELLDRLGLETVSAVGVSAGGPYALALAHALGPRVERVAVVSSLSPANAPHATPGLRRRVRWSLGLLQRHPALVRRAGNALLPLLGACPALLTRGIAVHATPSERSRLAEAGERMAATASFLDACAGGVGGLVADYLTYAAPWGFDPAEVAVPVDLWHGLQDPLVPPEHALQLAATLPRCRTFLSPEEGHHFFRARLAEILGELVGATARVPV